MFNLPAKGVSWNAAARGGMREEGELLIPLAEDICTRIDTAGRGESMCAPFPDGLRDLNKP